MDKIYIIQGEPVPLMRPRFSMHFRKVYNSQRMNQLVNQIELREQHKDLPFFEGPLHIDIKFYMPIPKKITPKKKQQIAGTYHIFAPDIDNCIKYYLDIAQGVLFKNDCIVAELTSQKIYDDNPRTELTVRRL